MSQIILLLSRKINPTLIKRCIFPFLFKRIKKTIKRERIKCSICDYLYSKRGISVCQKCIERTKEYTEIIEFNFSRINIDIFFRRLNKSQAYYFANLLYYKNKALVRENQAISRKLYILDQIFR